MVLRITWKKLLLLGIILFVLGLSVFVFLVSFPQVETIYHNSVDLTTQGNYYSDSFRAESGYRLYLNFTTSSASEVLVRGQVVSIMFDVQGTTYKYDISIPRDDVYQVQILNRNAGLFTAYTNHYVGNFYLRRNAAYALPLYITALALVAVGILTLDCARAAWVVGYEKAKLRAQKS
jgi:hypothetical protein